MVDWTGRKVLVTGSNGFIGRHLCQALTDLGAKIQTSHLSQASHAGRDMRRPEEAMYACAGKDVVFNLAASLNGIGSMKGHHAEMIHSNTLIQMNILKAAKATKVGTLVMLSSACVYPVVSYGKIREETVDHGPPVKDSEGYGWAKRIGEIAAQHFVNEYDMRIVIARPFNAYGPGDRSHHVIPDLLRKLDTTPLDHPIEIWGGEQVRNLTFVSDWVDALIHLADHGPSGEPINLAGSEEGVSILDLALRLIDLYGRSNANIAEVDGPIGHMDRRPDLGKLRATGWKGGRVSLDDGLKQTVEWWRSRR